MSIYPILTIEFTYLPSPVSLTIHSQADIVDSSTILQYQIIKEQLSMPISDQTALYNLLKEAFLLLDFGDRVLFSRYNLTAPRFYALVHLGEEPGLSLKRLSQKMFCDKSNATRIFKGLEAEGYA